VLVLASDGFAPVANDLADDLRVDPELREHGRVPHPVGRWDVRAGLAVFVSDDAGIEQKVAPRLSGAHVHVPVGPPTPVILADRTAGRWSIDHRTCRTGRCGSSDGLTHPVPPGTTFVTGSAIPLAEG